MVKKAKHRPGAVRVSVASGVLFICSLVFPASAQYPGDFMLTAGSANSVYTQILRNTNGEPPHNPLRLASAFAAAGEKYNLSPRLLSAIAAVESMYYVAAVNNRTADYGIMQINAHNIKHYGFDKKKLLTNIEYSVEAGAIVLKWFKAKYAKKEANWFCRFNWGTRSVKSGVGKRICEQYAAKVRRMM